MESSPIDEIFEKYDAIKESDHEIIIKGESFDTYVILSGGKATIIGEKGVFVDVPVEKVPKVIEGKTRIKPRAPIPPLIKGLLPLLKGEFRVFTGNALVVRRDTFDYYISFPSNGNEQYVVLMTTKAKDENIYRAYIKYKISKQDQLFNVVAYMISAINNDDVYEFLKAQSKMAPQPN